MAMLKDDRARDLVAVLRAALARCGEGGTVELEIKLKVWKGEVSDASVDLDVQNDDERHLYTSPTLDGRGLGTAARSIAERLARLGES